MNFTRARGVCRDMKNRSRFLGVTLCAAGAALLATLAYEPAIVVAAFRLERVLSEAAVVVLGLTVVAACGMGGVKALR